MPSIRTWICEFLMLHGEEVLVYITFSGLADEEYYGRVAWFQIKLFFFSCMPSSCLHSYQIVSWLKAKYAIGG